MTDGGMEKTIDQRLAARNQGDDPLRRHDPGVKPGFADLDLFTPEAIARLKAFAGGDPPRMAQLSARALQIAQREYAMPVLPDLIDEAVAELDRERNERRAHDAEAQPHHAHATPRVHLKPAPAGDIPPREPLDQPSQGDPDQQVASSAPPPRRLARRASRVVGVGLVAASIAGALAYTGQLDALGLGATRETVTSSLAAVGFAAPRVPQQTAEGNLSGASSPSSGPAESQLPVVKVAAADLENETPGDSEGLAGGGDETGDAESLAVGNPRWEEDRRADEATLTERWPEMGEATEEIIKQRFREIRDQAEQARQELETLALELDQRYRRQNAEMQARHARERTQAGGEGADAARQTQERHRQERDALQGDQQAVRELLRTAHEEIDRQLQEARRELARAREEAGGGEAGTVTSMLPAPEQPTVHAAPPSHAAHPEDLAAPSPGEGESGLQLQSEELQRNQIQPDQTGPDQTGDRPSPATVQDPAADADMMAGVPGQPEPLVFPQQKTPEAAAVAEPSGGDSSGNDEQAAAPSPEPRATPSPSAAPSTETGQDAPVDGGLAAGRAETTAPEADGPAEPAEMAQSFQAEEAAPAPVGAPKVEPQPEAAPAGQAVADLVERGNVFLGFGDLASARLFYQLAANRGSPEGAMLMGMTFDPVYFARVGIQGTQPRIEDALKWYRKAITMGSGPAEVRMNDLRSWLERSAAAGDAQAQAALHQLR